MCRVVRSVFIQAGRACVLLTGVHFQQCSEYWVMCINVSFTCELFLLMLYMWYLSVLQCFPFFCVLIISTVSDMVPC
jgi:hypothetical protein